MSKHEFRCRPPLPESSSGKRKAAHHHGFETELTLYGRSYRGLVVHSSAHDERKMKKLRRLLKEDLDTITKTKADHDLIVLITLVPLQRTLLP